ncbi:MAG: phytoene desaturase family protein [Thermoleophilia bacterium]
MERKLVIIGAGVAGLTAGCYAARSGYRTTILEMAATPGGLCTSWRRKGYLFDGSVAGLAGTAPGSPIYRLWQDTGVIDYCPLHDADNFGSIHTTDGRLVTVYTNIDRLEAHLLKNFPRDAGAIREFAAALRACLTLDIPFITTEGWAGVMESIRAAGSSVRSLPVLVKYGRLTLRRFIGRLADPVCAEVFGNLVHFGGPDVPLLTVLLPIAYSHRRITGIPRDGWLSFARAIERRFVEYGGDIRYGSKAARLATDGGAVVGVEVADGRLAAADRVLSAADGHFTHTVLLGESVDSDGSRPGDPGGAGRAGKAARFDPSQVSDQPVQVNLGVAADWSAITGPLTYILPDAPHAAGRAQTKLTVHNKYFDPHAAPAGKSALTVFLDSDYSFWKELEADRTRYEAEKRRCAELVIEAVGRRRPAVAGTVEVVDVATPLTRERYTGNWLGAMQARRPDANMMKALVQGGPRYDHPRLKGFYMAGQWVESWGGITTAAQSGRKAVQAMCRKDGVRFAS